MESGNPANRISASLSFSVFTPSTRNLRVPNAMTFRDMMRHTVSKAGILLSAYPGVVEQGALDIP